MKQNVLGLPDISLEKDDSNHGEVAGLPTEMVCWLSLACVCKVMG